MVNELEPNPNMCFMCEMDYEKRDLTNIPITGQVCIGCHNVYMNTAYDFEVTDMEDDAYDYEGSQFYEY